MSKRTEPKTPEEYRETILEAVKDTETPTPQNRYDLTDLGATRRFIHRFGTIVKFNHDTDRYHVWNRTYWEPDLDGKVFRLAKELEQDVLEEIDRETDTDKRQRLTKELLRFQNAKHIRTMLGPEMVQSEETIAITNARLDASPTLLCVQNGVIDLEKIEFRDANPEDLITKCAGTEYHPDATCPQWGKFLDRVFAENREMIAFIQRAVGYSLTGLTKEQCFFLCYGTGANGKSVFTSVLRSLLRDYSKDTSFDTFATRPANDADRAMPSIAELRGARLVTAAEGRDVTRIDTALIKRATGEDPLQARQLYGRIFSFFPQFKLWLATNHKPIASDTTEALWRRLLFIPFNVMIPKGEQDHDLPKKLREELPGILNWALEGLLEYWDKGLQPPKAVLDATDSYRNESDPLREFIETECILGNEQSVDSTRLYKAFSQWMNSRGDTAMSSAVFGKALKEKGILSTQQKRKGKVVRFYHGIALEPNLAFSTDENSISEQKTHSPEMN